jgi:hypothetical protein
VEVTGKDCWPATKVALMKNANRSFTDAADRVISLR